MSQTLAAVAKHDPGGASRHEQRYAQFQPRQGRRGRQQQVAAGEYAFFAHVQYGNFAAVMQHLLEFRGTDGE